MYKTISCTVVSLTTLSITEFTQIFRLVGGQPELSKNCTPSLLYTIYPNLPCPKVLITHGNMSDKKILRPVKFLRGPLPNIIQLSNMKSLKKKTNSLFGKYNFLAVLSCSRSLFFCLFVGLLVVWLCEDNDETIIMRNHKFPHKTILGQQTKFWQNIVLEEELDNSPNL